MRLRPCRQFLLRWMGNLRTNRVESGCVEKQNRIEESNLMKAFITKAAMMLTMGLVVAETATAAFPAPASGTPVGTPIGLGLLVIGAAAAGAYALRRK